MLLMIGVVWLGGLVRAGEVHLPDGRVVAGDVTLNDDGAVVVTVPGRTAQTFPLDKITRATISPAPKQSASSASASKPSVVLDLPWPWQAYEVGTLRSPTTATVEGGTISVTAAGWGQWPNDDSLGLVGQTLDGDGQVIARVALPDDAGSHAVGGVMIRESSDPSSPQVAVTLGPIGEPRLRARPFTTPEPKPGQQQPDAPPPDRVASRWVRLTRSGDMFVGYVSEDGSAWRQIDARTVKMKPQTIAGLATSSTLNMPAGPVKYERVTVGAGAPDATSAGSPLPATGVVMADGSATFGDVVGVATDHITLKNVGGAAKSIPAESVAWVVLQPTFPNLSAVAKDGASGAVLKSGDFFEGESIELADGKVTVTSVVLGPKSFDRPEVVAIVLRKPDPWDGAWHARDKAGNVVSGTSAKIEDGKLVVGNHRVPTEEVTEIFAPQK
jgi:hypothetical protein